MIHARRQCDKLRSTDDTLATGVTAVVANVSGVGQAAGIAATAVSVGGVTLQTIEEPALATAALSTVVTAADGEGKTTVAALEEEKVMGEAGEEAGSRISHEPFCHVATTVPICGAASCFGCATHMYSPT